ncbi:hypothetical protein JCM10207_004507 [Rhodosporidiobolus poonsookiae]
MQGVSVAYETLPSSADYNTVRADIQRQLPLRNLHWVRKSGAIRTIRTIQALAVDFKPLESYARGASSADLLARPYLHVLFVVCDDNEVYRATLRSQIREWLDTVTAKQHQEWLIVHVTSGRGGVAKFYQRKGAIVDKIKADFNVGKKDRCIQAVQGASADDPTAWAEFCSKVKEGILTTFDANVGLYEENVRKADSQRQLEGWQFLPFFRQKEALADSFEAMSLDEDALIQYDELEASFFQHLKDHNATAWFQNLGGQTLGDDALPILATDKKPYRKLIASNSISVFDFRIYLFARQATMLFNLGRVVDVARRGAYFVSTFARTLREHQSLLGSNFVESWTYCASLSIVDVCESKIGTELGEGARAQFVAVKAELLELAKKQLDKIGMSAGHLPTSHPFVMSLNENSAGSVTTASAKQPADRAPVTRQELLAAIADRAAFDRLYSDLVHRTILSYQHSGRKRCTSKLQASLAALEHERGRLVAAQKLYSQLPAHYTDGRWTSVEAHLLDRCGQLQAALNMTKERLLSTLALIRSGMAAGSTEWSLETVADEDPSVGHDLARQVTTAKRLMEDVQQLSGLLSKDFAAVAFPTFAVRLHSSVGSRPSHEDGVTATAVICNYLPCAISVDEIRLKFVTTSGDQLWLTTGTTVLEPGETVVGLFCPTTTTGRIVLELSQLRFSRIIFQYSHRQASPRDDHAPFGIGTQPSLLLQPDYQAVRVFTEEPDHVHLDQVREIILGIDPGRNTIVRIALQLLSADADVEIATSTAQLLDVDARRLSSSDTGGLVLHDLKPYEIVRVRIPVYGQPLNSSLQFNLSAEYTTTQRPQTRRHLRRLFAHSLALPLAVNVQDYFREQSLLSKFSVTTDGVQGLEVKAAQLSAPASVHVTPCRSMSASSLFISPLQTANFLFKLTCDEPAAAHEPMRLSLTYSTIEDGLRARLAAVGAAHFKSSTLTPYRHWLCQSLNACVLESTQSEVYNFTRSLAHLEYDHAAWLRRAQHGLVPEAAQPDVLQAVEAVYKSLKADGEDRDMRHWRTLDIPLELPSLHILSLVRIAPDVVRTEVGQAISATLYIRSSFRWRRSQSSSAPIRLAFAVVASAEEWVVSGQTRGEFLAEPDVELSVRLVLVPLRPAALFMPSVAIQPLSASNEFISCETQHSTAALRIDVLPIASRTTFAVAPLALTV